MGANPYIGEIRIFGFNYAPAGWALCNGQVLSISQYSALFALIGTSYGATAPPPFNCPICRAACRCIRAQARA